MNRHSIVLAALAVLSLATGCSKPKEGEACTGDKGTCLDKENAIVCIGGTFAKVKCAKSATGCMEVVGSVSCDIIKDVGTPCEGKGGDCSSDGKKMLACEGGKWAFKMNCSKLCVSNVEGVRCENASGAAGDPCTKEQFDQAVCSADKQVLLVCDGASFKVASSCKGQNHCRAVAKNIECDTSVADVDDPCEEDGTMACDPAKKTLLKCTSNKFVVEKKCPKRCMNAFNDFKCE